MIEEISDLSEARYAAEGFMASVALAALTRVLELGTADRSLRSVAEAASLAVLSGRITQSLEAGEEAERQGDGGSAALEWTRALVLMNRLAEKATGPAGALVCYQKSGRAG